MWDFLFVFEWIVWTFVEISGYHVPEKVKLNLKTGGGGG
jgi:hypothetical protein